MLQSIRRRDAAFAESLEPPIIFEGNRPGQFTATLARNALMSAGSADKIAGLLGEAVELGPPTTLRFQADSGRGAMVIAPAKMRVNVLSAFIASAKAYTPDLAIEVFDGSRGDDGDSFVDWMKSTTIECDVTRPRDAERKMIELADRVAARVALESGLNEPSTTPETPPPLAATFSLDPADGQTPTGIAPANPETQPFGNASSDIPASDAATPAGTIDDGRPILVIIDALDRMRDLRQSDTLDFSMDAANKVSGGKAFQAVLRDGPSVGVYVIVTLPSAETLSRWLPRQSQHDLELRLVGPINAADSSLLIDSPAASELSPATMILYDDADGTTTKFRICEAPSTEEVDSLLQRV